MTPEAAMQRFWEGFGMPAYAASSVPHDAEYPYLTYDMPVCYWGQGEAAQTVNLWFRTDSEAAPNAKAREIGGAIGPGGVQLRCDGGTVWLKRGSPFAQAVADEDDPKVKRRYLNVSLEYNIA